MTFDELVGVVVAVLVVTLAAVIRQLWRLGERLSRLEGSRRSDSLYRD